MFQYDTEGRQMMDVTAPRSPLTPLSRYHSTMLLYNTDLFTLPAIVTNALRITTKYCFLLLLLNF
jgi:hypothetical protein